MKHLWADIALSGGVVLDDGQLALLDSYRDWLRSEAIPAGGLGPAEESRLDRRHIADSLIFAVPFDHSPPALVDLGTGVGLPGIPLAILWPGTPVTLVDRSGKRVDLARRATRVLGLDNVEVIHADLETIDRRFPAIVSRATVPPTRFADQVRRMLLPGGMAVVGGSWRTEPREPGWETREIPVEMLDRTIWLLIMRRE